MITVTLFFRQQNVETVTESYMVEVSGDIGESWGGSFQSGGLDMAQVTLLHKLYQQALQRAQRTGNRLSVSGMESLRSIGNQLYEALPAPIHGYLEKARQHAQLTGQQLDIQLRFAENAHHLQNLPWELLHHPERRLFLGLHGGSISRQTPQKTMLRDFLTQPHTLRWVGVWAEPQGVAPLTERWAYRPNPHDNRQWLVGADTLAQLRQFCQSSTATNALHIVAHGVGGQQGSGFELAFEAADGTVDWINSEQLVTQLSAMPALRFVYLDVCGGGEGSLQHAYDDLAQALAGLGITAIVAMQGEMGQHAAGLFAQTMYDRWNAGLPLTVAVLEGRQAIRTVLDDPVHWSVPTLTILPAPTAAETWVVRSADRVLDYAKPISFLAFGIAFLLLYLGYLSRRFATMAISFDNLRGLIVPLWEALPLPLLGGLLLWPVYRELCDQLELARPQRRHLLVQQLGTATIFSNLIWFSATVFWLFIHHAQLVPPMWLRQFIWFVVLGLLFAAGTVGSRSALRLTAVSLSRERQYMSSFLHRFQSTMILTPLIFPAGLITGFILVDQFPLTWLGEPIGLYFTCGMVLALLVSAWLSESRK